MNVLRAQQRRQVFVVGDVLDFGHDNPPTFLEEDLIRPMRIDRFERLGDPVVLPEQQCVHNSQLWIFLHTGVTCTKFCLRLADYFGVFRTNLHKLN